MQGCPDPDPLHPHQHPAYNSPPPLSPQGKHTAQCLRRQNTECWNSIQVPFLPRAAGCLHTRMHTKENGLAGPRQTLLAEKQTYPSPPPPPMLMLRHGQNADRASSSQVGWKGLGQVSPASQVNSPATVAVTNSVFPSQMR